MKRLLFFATIAINLVLFNEQVGRSQTAYTLPGATALPEKGTTYNLSTQTGNKSSLNFGSSTMFGVSANMNASDGSRTSTSSSLAPKEGTLKFSIGDTSGMTSAKISNLKSTSGITTSEGVIHNGGMVTVGSDGPGDFSSGDATLSGVSGSLQLMIDPAKTSFNSLTELVNETGQLLGQGSQNSNASATATVNSATNVDINTSGFSTVFMQAF